MYFIGWWPINYLSQRPHQILGMCYKSHVNGRGQMYFAKRVLMWSCFKLNCAHGTEDTVTKKLLPKLVLYLIMSKINWLGSDFRCWTNPVSWAMLSFLLTSFLCQQQTCGNSHRVKPGFSRWWRLAGLAFTVTAKPECVSFLKDPFFPRCTTFPIPFLNTLGSFRFG